MQTIVSRFHEDISWLDKANLSGLVVNKGGDVATENHNFVVESRPNFGANQYDLCHYIYENYDGLPDLMMFIQGNPFDHCSENVFWQSIGRNQPCFLDDAVLTAKKNRGWRKSLEIDAGFSEKNTSWYVDAVNRAVIKKFNFITCQIESYDEFMNALFQNYSRLEWLRFSPGSQYIVSKEQCRRYTRQFWKILRDFIPCTEAMNGGVEAHLIERALGLIFLGVFTERPQIDTAKLVPKQINYYAPVPIHRKLLRLL